MGAIRSTWNDDRAGLSIVLREQQVQGVAEFKTTVGTPTVRYFAPLGSFQSGGIVVAITLESTIRYIHSS